MLKTKKEFQKAIKNIRNSRNAELGINSNYPKPMMTQVQMDKREATVNCGGEFGTPDEIRDRANYVMADARFKEFLDKHNATANLELNAFNTYQIRIHF